MSELFLIAQVAGRRVAVPAEQVNSVVDIGPIVPIPRAPAGVRGLAALRSRVLTVIDPCIALGVPATQAPGRAVVARIDGHHYAFLVDALDDVAPFERVIPGPATSRPAQGHDDVGGWSAAESGVVVRDGEPLMVLDLAALLPCAAATPFARAAVRAA